MHFEKPKIPVLAVAVWGCRDDVATSWLSMSWVLANVTTSKKFV